MLGFPWYDGPSGQTYQRYNEVFHYLGRLQERCYALNWLGEKHGLESQQKYLEEVDKLDRLYDDGAEYTDGYIYKNADIIIINRVNGQVTDDRRIEQINKNPDAKYNYSGIPIKVIPKVTCEPFEGKSKF